MIEPQISHSTIRDITSWINWKPRIAYALYTIDVSICSINLIWFVEK